MAAKKRSKTPAVRYLRYELTNSASPGTETSHFIDLAKDLSAINRRLYRQGRNYHVKRVSIVSSNTIAGFTAIDQTIIPGSTALTNNAGRVTVSTVPDSWTAQNSWKRGFNLWTKMNRDAMESTGLNNIQGKFADFKVYLSADHRTGTVLTPQDNGGNALQMGEWNYAEVHSPDGTTGADTFQMTMLGDHVGSVGSWTTVGLIKSYGESRATVDNDQPNVPATASDDPLVNMFDHGTVQDEIITQLEAENDNAPYDVTNYPGSSTNMPKPLVVHQTTLGADGRSTMGSFNAMCGLLELETTSPLASDVYSVLVEVAPGNYRGIGAEVIA